MKIKHELRANMIEGISGLTIKNINDLITEAMNSGAPDSASIHFITHPGDPREPDWHELVVTWEA